MNPPKRECRNCIHFIFHQIKKNDEGINREICSLNHEFVGNRRSACLYHRFDFSPKKHKQPNKT